MIDASAVRQTELLFRGSNDEKEQVDWGVLYDEMV